MTIPRLSVLMTCYNRSQFIRAAIESVLVQTFADFELVIVDDCSTDGSLQIAREYSEVDKRVRVHANTRRLGQFPNRNFAATLATGEYMRFADSDDIQYPHCLATLVSLLDAEPEAALALGGSRAWPGGPVPVLLSPRDAYAREFLGTGLFNLGPGAALFRTAAFIQHGGFPIEPAIGPASDYLFWLRLLARVHCVLAPGDLFWYRTHEAQELNDSSHAVGSARLGAHVWHALHSPACPLDGDERSRALRNYAGRTAIRVWRDIRAANISLALDRVRASGMGWRDWLQHARRPVREPRAEMAVDAAGQPLIPSWVRIEHSGQAPPQ